MADPWPIRRTCGGDAARLLTTGEQDGRRTGRPPASGFPGAAMLAGVGIDEVLAASRAGVHRLTPVELVAARERGALVVDTRTEAHRRVQGEFPGALVIDRTVLEWRLDPQSPFRIPEASGPDLEVVVVCRHGYSSSLAAASLRAIGLHRATDLAGGVAAWLAAGLPMAHGPADVRE